MRTAADDKVLIEFSGKSAIRYSIEAFARSQSVNEIVIVVRDSNQQTAIQDSLPNDLPKRLLWAPGGERRQDSVWSGLERMDARSQVVLVHDGARPLIASDSIDRVADLARTNGAACIAHPVADTLKRATPDGSGLRLQTVDRSRLWAMETPQAFKTELIKDAYRAIQESNVEITDDLSAIESLETAVHLIENDGPNPKLTTPKDIAYVDFLIREGNPR